MKIRQDYVSNSSTSSFFVVGHSFPEDEIIEIAKKHGFGAGEGDEDDVSTWEATEFLEEKFPDLEFNSGLDSYYEEWCVGMGFDQMKDDETKHDFLCRVEEELKKLTGKKVKADAILDAGRDG